MEKHSSYKHGLTMMVIMNLVIVDLLTGKHRQIIKGKESKVNQKNHLIMPIN